MCRLELAEARGNVERVCARYIGACIATGSDGNVERERGLHCGRRIGHARVIEGLVGQHEVPGRVAGVVAAPEGRHAVARPGQCLLCAQVSTGG